MKVCNDWSNGSSTWMDCRTENWVETFRLPHLATLLTNSLTFLIIKYINTGVSEEGEGCSLGGNVGFIQNNFNFDQKGFVPLDT